MLACVLEANKDIAAVDLSFNPITFVGAKCDTRASVASAVWAGLPGAAAHRLLPVLQCDTPCPGTC